MKNKLFRSVDNSPLVIFRMIFGLLVCLECWGAIGTGWIRRVLIEPNFTFNFIPFDFLQPLSGDGMYYYYGIMGALGICIMLGFRYVISSVFFTILWAGVYFMQKSAYNNHYYLLFLLGILMSILPAHKDLSVDAKKGYVERSNTMPHWCQFLIIVQLWIMYSYASVAKIYPDWLDGTVAKSLMFSKSNYPIIGAFLQQNWVCYVIAYFGILFDLLIVPALLWKKTRKVAFGISVFFHLFNSIVFQIGIFPFLSLGFTLFFFPSDKVRKWFYPLKLKEESLKVKSYEMSYIIKAFLFLWITMQVLLPIRHWFIPGDVLWTEEGHRMSWRMMLRQRSGSTSFRMQKLGEDDFINIKLSDYLTRKQIRNMSAKPDLIWQFAQHLKKEYVKKGVEIKVFVDSWVSINGHPTKRFIDPEVDLAAEKWSHFKHSEWLESSPQLRGLKE